MHGNIRKLFWDCSEPVENHCYHRACTIPQTAGRFMLRNASLNVQSDSRRVSAQLFQSARGKRGIKILRRSPESGDSLSHPCAPVHEFPSVIEQELAAADDSPDDVFQNNSTLFRTS
jgi:hypothetical protein